MRSLKKYGVFCLEGDWNNDLMDRSTIEPILQLLSVPHGAHPPYIHRDAGSFEELEYYLKKWGQKQYARYPILYMAFHGRESGILVGRKWIDIQELKEPLARRKTKAIIHFGSCETLMADQRSLKKFMRGTNIVAVMGYTKRVDWFESTAFELLLLYGLQSMSHTTVHQVRRLQEDIRHNLKRSSFFSNLGFRMIMNDDM